ncbi:hypothetical protein [Lachnoclostridium sp.]|uniref:hypothetical protein n=1 Tax=Lachnoclostridium sp. TaxID=2028282 RepID=UPI00289D226E|nr:hypothetical protein [Lachnoclostridium sp.]
MEQIKLKDGTLVEIIGATSNSLSFDTTEQSPEEIIAKLTEKNLERFEIINEAEESLHVYKDKKINFPYDVYEKSLTVNLVDVNVLEKQVKAQQAEIDLLKQCTKELSQIVFA